MGFSNLLGLLKPKNKVSSVPNLNSRSSDIPMPSDPFGASGAQSMSSSSIGSKPGMNDLPDFPDFPDFNSKSDNLFPTPSAGIEPPKPISSKPVSGPAAQSNSFTSKSDNFPGFDFDKLDISKLKNRCEALNEMFDKEKKERKKYYRTKKGFIKMNKTNEQEENSGFGNNELKECMYYSKTTDKHDETGKRSDVTCTLCPHLCRIKESKTGICKTRINIKGVLRSLNYEKLTSIALDPIEKKPLYHFYPGNSTLSVGSFGCNFKCLHCQNFEISNVEFSRYQTMDIAPETIAYLAKQKGSEIISYTYNEPTIFYEFVLNTARYVKNSNEYRHIKNVLVTNGFINKEPLKELSKYIDAANIDLKSFSDDFYKKICFGRLQPVLDSIMLLKKENIHIELTYLIIPDLNDSEKEIEDACRWISSNLGNDVPLHFSRFFPMYRMQNKSPTSLDTLIKARDIAKRIGLNYCYIGNVQENSHNGERIEKMTDTVCPKCNKLIIQRKGYEINSFLKKEDRKKTSDENHKIVCECGFEIYGRI